MVDFDTTGSRFAEKGKYTVNSKEGYAKSKLNRGKISKLNGEIDINNSIIENSEAELLKMKGGNKGNYTDTQNYKREDYNKTIDKNNKAMNERIESRDKLQAENNADGTAALNESRNKYKNNLVGVNEKTGKATDVLKRAPKQPGMMDKMKGAMPMAVGAGLIFTMANRAGQQSNAELYGQQASY